MAERIEDERMNTGYPMAGLGCEWYFLVFITDA
jgi:hypothetical protein